MAKLGRGYYFDALGRRVAKQVSPSSGSAFTQTYVYLGASDHVLQATDGSGNVYTYVDGENPDEHLGKVGPLGAKSFVTDHVGSVLNEDPAGAVQGFSPWGERLDPSVLSISASIDPLMRGWQGLPYDPESQMYNNWHREYDPSRGGFITVDPMGFGGGDENLYRSRVNNPMMFTDPSGWIVKFVGDPELRKILEQAYADVRSTARGKQLCEQLEVSPGIYTIGATLDDAFYDPNTLTISIDPNFHPVTQTTEGPEPAPTDVILGHEIGHAATGTGDTGPGNMDNTRQNENPIRNGLGQPERTVY